MKQHINLVRAAALLLFGAAFWPGEIASAINLITMYRGSCQTNTGVILKVDDQKVTFLSQDGRLRQVPRYEIVGLAVYPLPYLPVKGFRIPEGTAVKLFHFDTYNSGDVESLASGWPIEYNEEYIHILRRDGHDQLVHRDEVWSVDSEPVSGSIRFQKTEADQRFHLRHPLAFEKCPRNVVGRGGTVKSIIPQKTYSNPIEIKTYQDHLEAGYKKLLEYLDRQRFYAVPQYYGNKTLLGSWFLLGSRYSNVGARQTNFIPLVQDEFSEGPFGYQRIVKSGTAPLAWSLHAEPLVQVFYGLKADYVHFEVFFDPTSPLIGERYDWSKKQLDSLDTRLIEKGGLEFGVDLRYFSLLVTTSSGNMGVRAGDAFEGSAFSATRVGVRGQYNYYNLTVYYGKPKIAVADRLSFDLEFLKVLAQGPLGDDLRLKAQYIRRNLDDSSSEAGASLAFQSEIQTLAAQVDYDLNYRWTLYLLFSLELQKAKGHPVGEPVNAIDEAYNKLASGFTIAF